MTSVISRIYVGAERVACPAELSEVSIKLASIGGVAWIGLTDPNHGDLQSVANEFSLHPLAVEDARKGHQRAKFER